MWEARFAVAIGVVLTVAGQACGDDDPSPDENPADTTATATGGGTGGGGSGGMAASGSAGDASGSSVSQPVPCGETICAPPEGSRLASACCADPATSTCGLMFRLGGGMCMSAADPDPRCPSVQLTGGLMLPSCCTSEGRCGLDSTMFGQPGCTSLEDAAARSEAGTLPYERPDPQGCDDSDAGR